ncbi:MAG: sensor histidine kinase [Hyphomonadaceae bacterium JAD_PAG50586_4]|nr:MAG: sensor histidine kinase [Hyphomonadaceae bacterium JAD_PAG50586_4]
MRIQTRRAATPRESSLVTLRRLIRENARLNRLCENNSGIAERYALLRREGDHRIKNSLQVVASLLDVQARRAPDSSTHAALHAAAARVLAIARIHDALQLNHNNDDVVDLGALLTRICVSLDELAGDSISVQIDRDAAPIEAPLTLAQPIALAVNELVLNALRHAFPKDGGGSVCVTLCENDRQLEIRVADNGHGLPDNYATGKGYGMRLVTAMVAKLSGHLDVQNSGGACFILTAPRPIGAAHQQTHSLQALSDA